MEKLLPALFPDLSDDADVAVFYGLSTGERDRVTALHAAFDSLPLRARERSRALETLAAGELAPLGLSYTRLRILYGEWRRKGWRALFRHYKGGTARVNATFLQWFVGLHERCQRERTGATAWRMFRYQYERWLDGDATAAIPGLGASPPPPCGHERVPAGHGYRNLMRHIAVIQRYRLWMSRVESRRKSSLF